MNEKKNIDSKSEEKLPPGGHTSSLLFLAIGVIFFVQSLQLYQKDPSPSGAGTFPMIISGLLIVLTVIDFLQKLKQKTEVSGLPAGEKLSVTLKYLFPKDSLVFLLMSIAFYLTLEFGVSFMIASPIFLLISMCYLIPHSFVKNLIYTVVSCAAIYVIFTMLFKVSLP